MRKLLALSMAVLLIAGIVGPAFAQLSLVTASAPLEDQSDHAVNVALQKATQQAVDRARAQGLEPIGIHRAFMTADRVTVQLVASDEPGDQDQTPRFAPDDMA